jgi:hypothetical protein
LQKEQIIQKTNKRYAAHIFDITQSGPGGLCGGRKAGIKALVCQPCSDEARIEIKASLDFFAGILIVLFGYKILH